MDRKEKLEYTNEVLRAYYSGVNEIYNQLEDIDFDEILFKACSRELTEEQVKALNKAFREALDGAYHTATHTKYAARLKGATSRAYNALTPEEKRELQRQAAAQVTAVITAATPTSTGKGGY